MNIMEEKIKDRTQKNLGHQSYQIVNTLENDIQPEFKSREKGIKKKCPIAKLSETVRNSRKNSPLI